MHGPTTHRRSSSRAHLTALAAAVAACLVAVSCASPADPPRASGGVAGASVAAPAGDGAAASPASGTGAGPVGQPDVAPVPGATSGPSPADPPPGDASHSVHPTDGPPAADPSAEPPSGSSSDDPASPSDDPDEPASPPPPSDTLRLERIGRITGGLSPKSVVASQTGRFFVQNMMYRHTISVYDRDLRRVKTIRDRVDLAQYGYDEYTEPVLGAPVEAAVTPDRRSVFISQYSMYGPGFPKPGWDKCTPADGVDRGFVYQIDVETLEKVRVLRAGSVPKYLAVSPDGKLLLVGNWCSWDLYVFRVADGSLVTRVRDMGPNPRGIAFSPDSSTAWIALMGGNDLVRLDLTTFEPTYYREFGAQPRHLVMSPSGEYLYASFNDANEVVKIDVTRRRPRIVDRVRTGREPRTMDIAADGRSLYVVNYTSGTASKIRTRDMRVIQTLETEYHPIGLTYDSDARQLWIACYSGVLLVYRDEPRQTAED